MPGRADFAAVKALFALLALLLLAGGARAYVGPPPGSEFIGYFLSLVLWLVVALSSLLLWPVYALLRRFRRRGTPDPAPEAGAEAAPSAEARE